MLGTAFAYIADAFFIVRISLAAATAPGEACLSGGGAGCWAPAGKPANASPSITPAAVNIFKTLFIPLLLGSYGLRPFDNANPLRARQDCRARQRDEQTVLHDTRYRAKQARQTRRVLYSCQMGIDNPVAAISDEKVAPLALSQHHLSGKAAFCEGVGHGALRGRQSERDHLHRQRKAADRCDP